MQLWRSTAGEVVPIIQFPTNSQSLNPYSYILNNPLSGRDPTGYVACGEVSLSAAGSGTCDYTRNGKTEKWGYSVNSQGDVALGAAKNLSAVSGAVSVGVMKPNGMDSQTSLGPSSSHRSSSSGASDIGATAKSVGTMPQTSSPPGCEPCHKSSSTSSAIDSIKAFLSHPIVSEMILNVGMAAVIATSGSGNLPEEALEMEVAAGTVMRARAGQQGMRASVPSAEGKASPIPESYMNSKLLVDMEPARGLAGSTTNASGAVRNANYFWQQLIEREPQMFSKGNLYRVEELGLSPRVDATWVKYNPSHQGYVNDVLAHHHIGQGPVAVPLPQTVHEQWTSVLHGN